MAQLVKNPPEMWETWDQSLSWEDPLEKGIKYQKSFLPTHVYLWQIHFDIWQNQYNVVKLNKIKLKNNNKINFY